MITIKVKLQNGVQGFWQTNPGEWIDLRAAENMLFRKGEYKRIPLGVAMQLPEGYEALVAPRSSTFEKFGILMVNGIGIIDNKYCGDNDWWSFPALATRDQVILVNDRIAQFRILPVQPDIMFDQVDLLGNPDRGGFGSSGVR